MMGADIINANFAMLSRVIPWILPVVMVIPERDTPGITAST